MERDFKCDLCSEDFVSRSQCNHHMTREHGKPGRAPKKSFTCSVCEKLFGRKQHLVLHMRTHTGERPFKCTVDHCETAFKTGSDLKNHIKHKHSDERSFKCNFPGCTYAFKTSTNLAGHKKVHSDDNDKPFACSECDYKTIWKKALAAHRMRRHSGRRDFKCSHSQCSMSFKSSVELKRHFGNRHEERNVECDHPGCGRNFGTANALYKHRREYHSKKLLACPNVDCSFRTNTKWKLASHMIFHDGGNEKILCSIEGCQYKGNNNRALKEHMRLHMTGLQCPESGCGHYARTEETLKKHVKLHNSSGRPFKCPLCCKYYSTLFELQQHCFTHTNEKPFACGHCEFAASFRLTVKTHISSAHSNVKFPFIVHLLDDRECLNCKVTLPTAEFLLHCEDHVDPAAIPT